MSIKNNDIMETNAFKHVVWKTPTILSISDISKCNKQKSGTIFQQTTMLEIN